MTDARNGPAPYTYRLNDEGVRTFTLTLSTIGRQEVHMTETQHRAIWDFVQTEVRAVEAPHITATRGDGQLTPVGSAFFSGRLTAVAVTDAAGRATAPTLIADSGAGSYAVRADPGGGAVAAFYLNNVPRPWSRLIGSRLPPRRWFA